MKPVVLALAALLPTTVLALDEAIVFSSADGLDYAFGTDGAEVLLQATEFMEATVGSETVDGVEVLRLLPSCEASQEFLARLAFGVASTGPILATGTWGWDESGFVVNLSGRSVPFPDQTLWPLADDVPCRR